jgi:hypothetical protein
MVCHSGCVGLMGKVQCVTMWPIYEMTTHWIGCFTRPAQSSFKLSNILLHTIPLYLGQAVNTEKAKNPYSALSVLFKTFKTNKLGY